MYIICSRRLTLGLTVPLWRHRETAQEIQTERRDFFFLGRIQWPGQKHRLVKARQSESFRYTGHLFPGDFDVNMFSSCLASTFYKWEEPKVRFKKYILERRDPSGELSEKYLFYVSLSDTGDKAAQMVMCSPVILM